MTNPVQTITNTSQNSAVTSSTCAFTLPSTVTSGNAVGIGFFFLVSAGTPSLTSVTDDKGNTYTIDQNPGVDGFSGASQVVAHCLNITNGAKTVTVTVASTSSTTIHISGAAYEVTGATAVDTTNSGTQAFSASALVINMTTTAANEFAIVADLTSGGSTFTQNNGWTQDYTDNFYGSFNFSTNLVTPTANSLNATPSGSVHNAWSYIVFKAAGATYNGVNQLDYSVVSGSNSITSTGAAGIGTLAVTAGNLLVFIGQSANIVGAHVSDSSNANSWSSYNPNWAALNGTAGIAGFWCIAQSTGSFTFTLSAPGTCNAMYVWQANLTANNAGGFIQGAGNYQASIGSGANNATSGLIVGNANSNLYQGFCYAPSDTASPSQGAGFAGEVAVWKVFQGGTTAIGKSEDAQNTGSLAATFSTNNPGNPVYTLGAVFNLQALNLLMGQVIL